MTKHTTLIAAAIAGALLLLVGFSLIGANNSAVRSESNIIAADQQSQNVLGQYAPKLREALGVTSLQTDAVERVFTSANESRYGADGSQATFQWIREQNPNLDQSTFRRVVEMIEAGRNDFGVAQQRKIDLVRIYRTDLQTFPGSLFYGLVGRPSPQFFEKYGEIVISGHAAEAFKTKRDDGVQLK